MSVLIRDFCESDIAELVALYNEYILNSAITFDLEPYSVEERRRSWLCHYQTSGRHRLFVAEDAERVVGYASSSPFAKKAAYDTSVETSIYIHPDFHRKGMGARLYTRLFQVLETEDVHRAYAGITMPNDASVAIHKQFGFEQVGLFRAVGRKFGRYWDVAWYEKSIGNVRGDGDR